MSSPDDLPPAWSSMWRALKRGYQAEPRLLTISFSLSLLAALPDALVALLFMLLANGATSHDGRLVTIAMLGLATCAVATWFLRVISDRTQRRFRDRVTIALESHVAKLQASVQTITHHERPDFLDRLAVLRDQVFVLDHMYMSLFSTCGWMSAARRDHGAADVDSLVAGAAGGICVADGADVDVATSGGTRGGRTRRAQQIGWRGMCSNRNHRTARQRSTRHAYR